MLIVHKQCFRWTLYLMNAATYKWASVWIKNRIKAKYERQTQIDGTVYDARHEMCERVYYVQWEWHHWKGTDSNSHILRQI